MRRPSFSLSFVLLCAAALPAQRTWIVDSAGGAGYHFADLPPAVAAASRGDVILVRPGTGGRYTAVTVGKGIAIVGEGAEPIPIVGVMSVRGVPLGEVCTLRNLCFERVQIQTRLECVDNRGTVVLERIVDPADTWGALILTDCDLVIMSECLLWNPGGRVAYTRSRAVVINSELYGRLHLTQRFATLLVEESDVTFVDSFVRGADGFEVFCGVVEPGTPAIESAVSRVRLLGRCRIVGGSVVGGCGGFDQQPAVLHRDVRSTTWVDPLVSEVGGFGPAGTVIRRELSGVSPGTAPVGGAQTIVTYGPSGGSAALFASLPTGRAPIALPFGEVFIDPALNILVDAGSLGTARTLATTVSLAGFPAGLSLLYQSATLSGAGALELSNAAVAVVH